MSRKGDVICTVLRQNMGRRARRGSSENAWRWIKKKGDGYPVDETKHISPVSGMIDKIGPIFAVRATAKTITKHRTKWQATDFVLVSSCFMHLKEVEDRSDFPRRGCIRPTW